MLKNALYLDQYYKDECENKTNYLLVANSINNGIPNASDNKCISYSNMSDVGSLIGDQLLVNSNDSIAVEKSASEMIKTILISAKSGENIFKVVYGTDNFE